MGAKKRILVVDDEQLLLQGLGKALQTDAAEVITVETGEAALAEIASSPCHLCFLDVFLPDMDGTDVLKKIKIQQNRFGFEPEITAKVSKLKCRVYEVGISYFGRTYMEGKKIKWTDGVKAFWCIIRYGLFR